MLNFTKKLALMGFGVLATTQKKAEQIKNELIQEGTLSEQEGKKLLNDLMQKGEEAKKELEETVKKTVAKFDFATKDDIKNLEKKLNHLLKMQGKEKVAK